MIILLNKISTYHYGLISEYLALLFLKLKFYKIIERRHKTKLGEIDIIALKNDTIVFIEVKARKKYNPSYNVLNTKQINRITRAASLYLIKNKAYQKLYVRFDLISICKLTQINHIQNAW